MRVYLDYNATSPLDPRVLEEMLPYMKEKFGNPNSLHSFGREAREAVELARERVAKALNASPGEIVFTSGGTEGNNYIIKGVAFARRDEGKHIITTSVEHKCVLNTCKFLEKMGYDVTYLPVDREGFAKMDALEDALRDDTILVSVMLANNEVGTLEPVKEIAELVKDKTNAYVHTDACQALGKIPVDVKELGVDLLTLSAHKFYGPKGVGAVFVREGVRVEPLLHGGGQERGARSGTENVPGIVGIGKAAELAAQELEKDMEHLRKIQKRLMDGLLSVEDVYLNGPKDLGKRLPGNVNVSVKGVEGEALLLTLDAEGIAVSSGSACSSRDLKASHVLTAMGVPPELAHASLRFSAGRFTRDEEIEYVLEVFPRIVEKLRRFSALG